MIDALTQFRNAIRATGLEPPEVIEAGTLYRFPGVGKRDGNTAGWCVLFADGRGGCFGDWASGFSEHWQAMRDTPFTATERDSFKRDVAEARAQAEATRKAAHAEAAIKAAEIWNAAPRAAENHPYLVRKAIKANGVRQHNDALVIPVRTGGELHSLQFINANGEKRFHTGGRIEGGYFGIGATQDAEALCIAEGFATGATIHEATGYPVAVAFNAGNLEAVAKTLRKNFPTQRLIVCADDDAATTGNPGVTKATEAARAVGGFVAVPTFGDRRRDHDTDFNDMAALRGLQAVRDRIFDSAVAPEIITPEREYAATAPDTNWPEPQPLTAQATPELYPFDALPPLVRSAVGEVQRFVQAPVPLVASSALAALSLAIQIHTDVKRAEKLTGPVSLFLLTIADSGERKSTCDEFFTKAIREYENAQAEAAKPLLKDHAAAIGAWEAKHSGIKEKIRHLAKNGKPTEEMDSKLRDLERDKPAPPNILRLLYTDATPEALAYGLAKHWPAGGVVSAEAGLVFGAHGMSNESLMRYLTLLNILWDGGSVPIDRRTMESFTVKGARLTVALQVQEATLRNFLDRSGALARGTGFLARFLIAWPESTQGSRPFTEAPTNWPALNAFNRRIAEILDQPAPIEDGALNPQTLALTPEAKAAWVMFHDKIESELVMGGEFYDVRDVASKSADNAVRLAALFQVFEGGGSVIGINAFERASRIGAWHLNEARRFFGELVSPVEAADAVRLERWLLNYCRKAQTNVVPRREVQRNVTPAHLRQQAALERALGELIETGRVRLLHEGRRKEIHVNPALLERGIE